MTVPGIWHEYSCKPRMSGEVNTKHIKDLTFVPVSRFPYRCNTWDMKIAFHQRNLYAKIFISFKRSQVIDNRETAFWLTVTFGSCPLINSCQIVKHPVGKR